MWFVGESRWQVHGSTLLADSAGANGRLHNNNQCICPPFFIFCQSIPHTSKTNQHTQTHFFLISMCWHQEIAQGPIQHADIQLSAISLTIPSFPFSSRCPFGFHTSLSVPLTSSLYASLLSYFITLTPTPTTHLHMPLDSSPIIVWRLYTPSITLLIPVSSALLLFSTFSNWACIENAMSCFPLCLVCWWCHAFKVNLSKLC